MIFYDITLLFHDFIVNDILHLSEERCNWETPTGDSCIVVHQQFNDKARCVDGATIAWSTYGSGNCTITITSDVLERNGDWKVYLSIEIL